MEDYVGQRKAVSEDGWCCGKVVVVVESEGERRGRDCKRGWFTVVPVI